MLIVAVAVTLAVVAARGESEVERETISTNALISVKPHLQLMGETSVGVVWTTREKADGWVDWSQDGGATWRKAWNQRDGLRVDANDRVHKIVVEGYDPAKPLKYRVRSRAYKSFGPYKVVRSDEEESYEGGINAVLPADGTLSFAVFNDVHGDLETYPKLLGVKAAAGLSFTVFNGDIMSHVDDPEGLERGLLGPLAYCAARTQAPMWYLRGNHETRGAYARHLRDHLALQNDRYYGAVTLGRTRFVFLDTGEDKEDGHWEYSGLVDFEGYLAEQTAWLKREVEGPSWKGAVRAAKGGGVSVLAKSALPKDAPRPRIKAATGRRAYVEEIGEYENERLRRVLNGDEGGNGVFLAHGIAHRTNMRNEEYVKASADSYAPQTFKSIYLPAEYRVRFYRR